MLHPILAVGIIIPMVLNLAVCLINVVTIKTEMLQRTSLLVALIFFVIPFLRCPKHGYTGDELLNPGG